MGGTDTDLSCYDLQQLPERQLEQVAHFMLHRIEAIYLGHAQDMLHVDSQQKVPCPVN